MDTKITFENLPHREGELPKTTNTNPHQQLNQQPMDRYYVEQLMDWAFRLGHVNREPSRISVPGAVAMCMEEGHSCTQCNAFMVGSEFAHFHPHPDYSLHLGLPKEDADRIIEHGWGEWHPMILRGILPPNIIMLYAPRFEEEMEVARFVLSRSYAFAKGELASH